MLERIINFFKSIFSFFGGEEKKPSPTPTSTKTPEEIIPTTEAALPEIVDVEPQDGADVLPEDAEIVLINAEVEEAPIEVNPEPILTTPTEEPATPTTPEPTTPKHKPRYLWILDNGHGKNTRGKRSPKWDDGKQLLEYEFNRAIVKKIIDALEAKGVEYHNLVPEVNVGNILKTRVARANALNAKAKLPTVYVSVHSNAGQEDQPGNWSSAQGIETWYYRTSLNGRKIAKIFQKHLIAKTGWVNRDVRTGMNFYVLKNTAMPSVLTENGFFNNKIEGRKLLTDETRQLIADAHIEAILEIEKHGFSGYRG